MRRLLVPGLLALVAGVLIARRRRRASGEALAPSPPPPALPPAPRFLSAPWTLVTAPADRPELTVRYHHTEQMELDRVDVQETATQVFVTVLVRWQPPAGGWFAWDTESEATVALARPLDDRELVHAPEDLHDDDRPTPLYP